MPVPKAGSTERSTRSHYSERRKFVQQDAQGLPLLASREFRLIRRFVAAFQTPHAPFGPGDDCAVLPKAKGALCVTTDSVVEGVHFSLRWSSFVDVGHKALAVNLSDLAAMGATPKWFTCALHLPPKITDSQISRLAFGMSALAKLHHLVLVGGNVTKSQKLIVNITAGGEVKRGRALTRGGAKPGDWLYVSGTLGDARLGLDQLKSHTSGQACPERSRRALQRQLRPIPRVELGQLSSRFAHAAIDVSDGFAQDLLNLCHASKVGAHIDVGRLPLSDELRQLPPRRALKWALSGGEDYELVLAVPPTKAEQFERACRQRAEKVTPVGVVTQNAPLLLFLKGERISAPRGFDHFG